MTITFSDLRLRVRAAQDLASRNGLRVGLAEVAKLIAEADLSPASAARALFDHAERSTGAGQSFAETADFLAALPSCRDDIRVAEHTSTPTIFSAAALEGRTRLELDLFSLSPDLLQAADALLRSHAPGQSIAARLPDLGVAYDLAIVQPPFGAGPESFGSDMVKHFARSLAPDGLLAWFTLPAVNYNEGALHAVQEMADAGLHLNARIDVMPGAIFSAKISGVLLLFAAEATEKVFVARLERSGGGFQSAKAYLNRAYRKRGPDWAWLERSDRRTFSDLEAERAVAGLRPKGGGPVVKLSSLLDDKIEKADKPVAGDGPFLFLPEYALSRVTASLEDQTVKPSAVYRLPIDPRKADAGFLSLLLNSPYGRAVRDQHAHGATIKRLSRGMVELLEIPLPKLEAQQAVAHAASTISDLKSQLQQLERQVEGDWTDLSEMQAQLEAVRSVFDLEARLENWADELPYPLATVHRAFSVALDPREQLEAALHFFEITAVYLACIGASHSRRLLHDGEAALNKWLYPPGGASIIRTDFGFWSGLAGASFRSLKQLVSDGQKREDAKARGLSEMLLLAERLGELSKAIPPLEAARRLRNDWKGHGGHVKASDAIALVERLRQEMRHLYQASAPILRDLKLIKPGRLEMKGESFFIEVEELTGSDPKFRKCTLELSQPLETGRLSFWIKGASSACVALPFLQLGSPITPEDTSVYVYSRVEGDKFRWISYQEAKSQEVLSEADELRELIGTGSSENDPRTAGT